MDTVLAFASDYDGTLRRGRLSGVSAADREAIERFRAAGGLFGIDTGRTQRGLYPALEPEVTLDFAVLLSGALVLGPHKEVLEEHRIPRDAVAELVRRYRLASLGLYLVAGEAYWTTSPVVFVRRSRAMFNLVHRVSDIPDPLYGVAFRLLTERLARHLCSRINREMGDVVQAYQNTLSVDVVLAGCSKASGLATVRRELGVTVLGAMGDSYNDIPMLAAADRGYTFPDAPEAVRAAAGATASSVAEALDDMMLRGLA